MEKIYVRDLKSNRIIEYNNGPDPKIWLICFVFILMFIYIILRINGK